MNKNSIFYASPFLIWMSLFFIIPTFLVVLVAFVDQNSWDIIISVVRDFHQNLNKLGLVKSFSLAQESLLDLNFTLDTVKQLTESRVLITLNRTFWISMISAVIAIFLSLPTAHHISNSTRKEIWLLLLILPFWSNFLIRIFMWIKILGNNGLINSFLLNSNLIQNPIPLLYNNFAVTLVSIYISLPFAIIPIFSSIEKFDHSLWEVSQDLGAKPWQSFLFVFMPGIKTGLSSAFLFTFINTFGNYAVVRLVGGQDSYMLGNLVIHNATTGRNMPLAAAISTFISVLTLFVIMLINKSQKGKVA